jgi:pimeloyl-ACP methyl ester carboxylesterase
VALLATRAWGDEGAGAARPLALLVHGVTSSSRTWWRVGPALAARGFRVVAVDLRGHGASPRVVARLAAADLAADVAETLDAAAAPEPAPAAAEPAPAAARAPGGASEPAPGATATAGGGSGPVVDLLVGHSLGALVALELVAARPGLARRLVLEEPPGPASVDWAGLADGAEADARRAAAEPEALRRDLEAANPRWPAGEAERRIADLADCHAAAVAAALRPGVPFDLAALIAAARLPILLLLAEEALGSTIVGVDRKAAVAALGEGRTAQVLPVGHSIHRESLELWLAALDAWLPGS